MIRKILTKGIDNFKELIDNNYYYVDKTLLIKEILDDGAAVNLITRPRRFGKTLNMSMLQYFFEKPLENNKSTSYLFEGLNIFTEENKKYREEQGKYPLIYLTFKNASQDSWVKTYKNIKGIISKEYKRHGYLLEGEILSEHEKSIVDKIIKNSGSDFYYSNILIDLSEYLKRYYKENVVIIIDEYDTPLQSGYINGYLHEVIEFMDTLFVKGFKGNNALKRGILIGIMNASSKREFIAFNNASISTLLTPRYEDKFGFTEEEVLEMLKYYKLTDKYDGVKKFYKGYIFGKEQIIYNPWSIINYISLPENDFMPYWINTSSNEMLKEILQLDKAESKKTIELLLENKKVSKALLENVVYENITKNPGSAWSFLLHTGYLKAINKRRENRNYVYDIEIPNEEVEEIYYNILNDYFSEDIKSESEVKEFIESLLNEDFESFEIILKELYFKYISVHDVGVKISDLNISGQKEKQENFHHGFILGLLIYANKYYEIHSNREYGSSALFQNETTSDLISVASTTCSPDIVLIPKDKTNLAYVFEFKWASTQSKKTLESLLKLASDQIKEKKYVEGIRSIHDVSKITTVAVGFKGKEIDIEIT